MKFKIQYLIGIIIITIVVISGYLRVKYVHYKNFIISFQTLPYEWKLAGFYAKFARFPVGAKEYLEFVRSDSMYYSDIDWTGCYLKFDSINEEIILYSPGFDGDDDNLKAVYNPNDVDFSSSLLKDGDVILQIKCVTDFLFFLKDHSVYLNENRPDSTLIPIKRKLWSLAQCYADTLTAINEPDTLLIPSDSGPEYGRAWIEFRKISGSVTLRIYSELHSSLMDKAERELLAIANHRGLLQNVDNVILGFPIDFLGSKLCLDNLSISPNQNHSTEEAE